MPCLYIKNNPACSLFIHKHQQKLLSFALQSTRFFYPQLILGIYRNTQIRKHQNRFLYLLAQIYSFFPDALRSCIYPVTDIYFPKPQFYLFYQISCSDCSLKIRFRNSVFQFFDRLVTHLLTTMFSTILGGL